MLVVELVPVQLSPRTHKFILPVSGASVHVCLARLSSTSGKGFDYLMGRLSPTFWYLAFAFRLSKLFSFPG